MKSESGFSLAMASQLFCVREIQNWPNITLQSKVQLVQVIRCLMEDARAAGGRTFTPPAFFERCFFNLYHENLFDLSTFMLLF